MTNAPYPHGQQSFDWVFESWDFESMPAPPMSFVLLIIQMTSPHYNNHEVEKDKTKNRQPGCPRALELPTPGLDYKAVRCRVIVLQHYKTHLLNRRQCSLMVQSISYLLDLSCRVHIIERDDDLLPGFEPAAPPSQSALKPLR